MNKVKRVSIFIQIAGSGRHRISSQGGGTRGAPSQVAVMSEVDPFRQYVKDLFRQYVKDRLKIEATDDQELFLDVATELQSEGVVITHEVFGVIKATVDFTKEILEKGRT